MGSVWIGDEGGAGVDSAMMVVSHHQDSEDDEDKMLPAESCLDGVLFQDTWMIGDSISVRYAIRYRDSCADKTRVDPADMFIDLNDFRNLITIYQTDDIGSHFVPTIWNVNVSDRKLSFCPFSEFVYQAAVLSQGALSSQVYRGLLELLLVNLLPGNNRKSASVNSFSEIRESGVKKPNRKLQKTSKHRGINKRDDRLVTKTEFENGCEETISKLNGGSQESRNNCDDDHGENDLGDPCQDSMEDDSFNGDQDECFEDELDINGKSTKRKDAGHGCKICKASFKKESTLYLHQVKKHPSEPQLHIAKPSSLSKRVTRTCSTCKVCGIKLRSKAQEFKHYEVCHQDEKPVKQEHAVPKVVKRDASNNEADSKCQECSKVFSTVKHLVNHCRREHPDKPEICPEEPVKLGPLSSLHERSGDQGENGDQFRCGEPSCNLLFTRFLSLVDHERAGHPTSFICILCGLTCLSAEALISHSQEKHHNKSMYICRVCGFFNRTSRGLMIHTQQEHLKGSMTYQCEKCAYTSENYVTFGNHRRTAHREDNSKFVCEECGNNFASKQSLTSHRRLHNPDFKKFACKYCPQKFGHSSVLLIHMRVHTGEKPFVCNICGATFGSQTASTRHRRVVHAGESEMRYQCPDCGKKYPARAKQDFENHCKTHSGVRDHVCGLCGSAYFSKKGLRKHERAAHPAQKPMKPKPFKISEDQRGQIQLPSTTRSYNLVCPSKTRDDQSSPGIGCSGESLAPDHVTSSLQLLTGHVGRPQDLPQLELAQEQQQILQSGTEFVLSRESARR